MQNQTKPPALNEHMSKEEMAERVAEMLATGSDMEPIDETFLKSHQQPDLSLLVG